MINEVDEALRYLVKSDVVSGADIEVVFDAPTREWASRRNKPTVDLYLYDIREDIRRRSSGMVEKRDEQGMVEERGRPPKYLKLAYLVTAWTQRPEDEHRLLSALLACFFKHDHLPEESLTDMLLQLRTPLYTQIAYPPPEDRQVSDVWSSLGGDLKPSLDLVVTMIIQPERLFEVAPAVMEPLRLRTNSRFPVEGDDGERQLRRSRADASPDKAEELVAAAAEPKSRTRNSRPDKK